ncbi:hypothetical protein E4U16_004966 [Claviceps sp. LM84 group G4]|nr:hypothetical protein E4U16_004966 [Claviceps sp. LM84 group G4]
MIAGIGLMLAALAAAAPQLKNKSTGTDSGVQSSAQEVTPSGGSLYGTEQLLGGNAPLPNVETESAEVAKPETVDGQDADANLGLYLNFNGKDAGKPQPLRGDYGGTANGPQTYEYEKLNSDSFAPPGTDQGSVPNAKWPLGLSHNRPGYKGKAGWARQQNKSHLPAAKQIAGVDMKLEPNAYRELHWHSANEWALVLKGCARVAAINDESQSFTDDLCEGDVWFFPSGVPHSIQAFDKGVEFLLVFDSGDFDENRTFLISNMFARMPREVLSKNFKAPVDAFKKLPERELYIFNGTPAPKDIKKQNITAPGGYISGAGSYTYHWSQQKPHEAPGGTVKIIDPTTFPIAAGFSAALVTVKPGAMREIHWHTTSDEWSYFLQGSGRATIYAAPSAGQTFDFTSGDVGYIPKDSAHYIENTGTEDLVFLEVLLAPKFTDISVAQWLALTPKQTIQDHLGLPDELLENLPKEKTILKEGNPDLVALAHGGTAY